MLHKPAIDTDRILFIFLVPGPKVTSDQIMSILGLHIGMQMS